MEEKKKTGGSPFPFCCFDITNAVLLGMKGTVTMERLLTENEREKMQEGEAKGKAQTVFKTDAENEHVCFRSLCIP